MIGKEIIDSLHWRYATKKFSDRKISHEDLQLLKEATRLTASSYGLQPFKVIHVKNEELRKKVSQVAWNQPQITEASDLFIFAAKTNLSSKDIEEYINLIASTRNIEKENLDGFKNMMLGFEQGMSTESKTIWSQKQAYIALGNLLTTSALTKIDACPMEGFDPQQVTQVLNLDKEHLLATVICTLGYRSNEDSSASYKKVRVPEKEFFIER
ncbi:MAG: NAD(P)H-dependent oxidoreductase [Nanoarchaeota archaeon]